MKQENIIVCRISKNKLFLLDSILLFVLGGFWIIESQVDGDTFPFTMAV